MASAARPAAPLGAATLRTVATRLAAGPPGTLHAIVRTSRGATTSLVGPIVDPDDLIGVDAPPGWRGLAIVLAGASTALDPADAAVSADGVTLSLAIDRGGSLEVALRTPAGIAPIDDPGSSSGFLVDVARRVFGLPTLGPVPGPEALVTACWLEQLLDRVADPSCGRIRSWADALALHPLAPAPGTGSLTPDELARLTLLAAGESPWSRLHRSIVEREVAPVGLTPAQVAWMDWPLFARWTLGVHRGVTELLEDLTLFADGPLLRDVRYTVSAVGWLGFADRAAPSSTGDE
ncbi:MAG: hypothetical protein U0Q22_11055 [Acidimicrobiales bacterium]